MKIPVLILFSISALTCVAAITYADTIYLKNGRSIEGIIEKEDSSGVEINMGFGTMSFARSQIIRIARSRPEDSADMKRKWEAERKDLESKKKEYDEARENRFKNASEGWQEEIKNKKANEGPETKQIQISRDSLTKSIVVEVLLNDKVKASLVLDTGASLIALSRRMGEELGVDLSDTKNDVMELRLANGNRARAKAIMLDTIKIQDVEVKKVMAAVMLDEVPSLGSRDGLLGMSFLNRFNLNMDLKTMKMTLEKLEEKK